MRTGQFKESELPVVCEPLRMIRRFNNYFRCLIAKCSREASSQSFHICLLQIRFTNERLEEGYIDTYTRNGFKDIQVSTVKWIDYLIGKMFIELNWNMVDITLIFLCHIYLHPKGEQMDKQEGKHVRPLEILISLVLINWHGGRLYCQTRKQGKNSNEV
ncbi:hypothetical protein NC653_017311 [Populus alba x Populus x berolinensis]|uniref:Uncharacterized protein n=1 Tax=Populus alba x Populus x berolinensis TaxID=444605 RepID=A0AAD6QQ83_9ROSI|nr:hypothetical protein NC653_017311 [Populus alba x Populus x berolinensis]